MGEFTTVAKASAVADGELEAFDAGGTQVAVANVGGTYYAIDDTCTHQQCSLANGDLEGATVVCACHGSEFDVRTGEVLGPPATEPVVSYPVKVEGEDLVVEV